MQLIELTRDESTIDGNIVTINLGIQGFTPPAYLFDPTSKHLSEEGILFLRDTLGSDCSLRHFVGEDIIRIRNVSSFIDDSDLSEIADVLNGKTLLASAKNPSARMLSSRHFANQPAKQAKGGSSFLSRIADWFTEEEVTKPAAKPMSESAKRSIEAEADRRAAAEEQAILFDLKRTNPEAYAHEMAKRARAEKSAQMAAEQARKNNLAREAAERAAEKARLAKEKDDAARRARMIEAAKAAHTTARSVTTKLPTPRTKPAERKPAHVIVQTLDAVVSAIDGALDFLKEDVPPPPRAARPATRPQTPSRYPHSDARPA